MPPPGPGAKSTLSRENINQNQSQKTAPVHTGAVPSGVGPLLLFSFRAAGGRSGPGRNLVQTFRPKLSPCLRFLKTKGWLFFGKAVSRARWPGLSPALASAEAPAPAAAEAPAPAHTPAKASSVSNVLVVFPAAARAARPKPSSGRTIAQRSCSIKSRHIQASMFVF